MILPIVFISRQDASHLIHKTTVLANFVKMLLGQLNMRISAIAVANVAIAVV